MTDYRRPRLSDLSPGGDFGDHVLPNPADDLLVRGLVDVVFAPSDGTPPFAPQLVQQLLDRAPRPPEQTGVDDWNRPLRADEVAAIYGEPMTVTREQWLARADEVAAAWGRPLLGVGGLLDSTGPLA
jgi:hypothetical protein